MLLSFKYRMYPNEEQEVLLRGTLAHLCDMYNYLRSKKVSIYKENKINLSKTDLRRLALESRRNNPELKSIHSQVAQNVADRVYISFKNFFEKRARFPRFKKYKKYKSFTYPQSGFSLVKTPLGNKLYLSGIGYVRIFIHRLMRGKVNRLTIKKEVDQWYAIFLIEDSRIVNNEIKPSFDFDFLSLVPEDRIRGGDMGLYNFLILDDDSKAIEYPAFLRRSQSKLVHLQRHLSRKKKGSRHWRRLAYRLAVAHLHIKRQREDYQNKLVSTLLNKDTDVLVLEKLSIENMLRNHNLAKSIVDASFGRFATRCINKSRMLRKYVLFVDPWGTTQFCCNCFHWVPKRLSQREHNCPNCRTTLSRDLNSAKLIKWLGIHSIVRSNNTSCPPSDGGSSLAELLPLPSLRRMASRNNEAGSQPLLRVGGHHCAIVGDCTSSPLLKETR